MRKTFKPADYQALRSQNITQGFPTGETLNLDYLFVGAGPAALAGAIRLSQINKGVSIGVLEKASRLGGHSLSGAIINPSPFKKLFPNIEEQDLPFRLPVKSEKMYFLTQTKSFRIPPPPTIKNKGFYTASLCEVVRWLGEKAEQNGVNIFTSTAADKLISDKGKIIGVETTASGLDRKHEKTNWYQAPVSILAQNIFLSDGVRGNLSQTWLKWKHISSFYPEHYALGVKEVWKIKKPLTEVIHTVGFPLTGFGGSFAYPLSSNLISIGLVSGMDHPSSDWDTNKDFQKMKTHPFFQQMLKDGECLEWGAKAIPEGGFHSIPDKLSEDNVFLIGDAAGLVNVPALKGVHYAMLSGIKAAEYSVDLNKKSEEDTVLKKQESSFEKSPSSNQRPQKDTNLSDLIRKDPLIGKELYKFRNIIQIFQTTNKFFAFIMAGLSVLSGGRFPKDKNPKKLSSDAFKTKTSSVEASGKKKPYSDKSSSVYLSGNKTRDDIPSHLTLKEGELPEEVKNFYVHFCPAGVYENKNGKLIVNAPNCVDCKATDVLGPLWSPREGGSGPDYKLM